MAIIRHGKSRRNKNLTRTAHRITARRHSTIGFRTHGPTEPGGPTKRIPSGALFSCEPPLWKEYDQNAKDDQGAIAAAAAALLLVGGGGTFMSWNDNVTQPDQGIAAGNLALKEGEAGTWTLNTVPVGTNIDAVKVVPGDTLVFTQAVTYTTEGDDLKATLKITPGAITPVNNDEGSADSNLATQLFNKAEISLGETLPGGVTNVDATTYEFEENTTGTVNATVTIDFPFEGSTNDSQLGKVNLSGMALALTQTDANPAI